MRLKTWYIDIEKSTSIIDQNFYIDFYRLYWWFTATLVDGTMLDVEATFCYLGDMLCCGGGCDSAIAAKCCMAWGKFRKLLPVIIIIHLTRKIRGNMYKACIRMSMFHGGKTWGPNNPELQRLHCNDCAMIHWICGIKDRWNTLSFIITKTWCQGCHIDPTLSATQMVWPCATGHVLY